MIKWKLKREIFGSEEFTYKVGDEVTVGRGVGNTLPLSSLVISRKHCVIHFLSDKAVITDSGSSNGVYVGLTKIPPNISYDLKNFDIIGFGWTLGAIVTDVTDDQKYMFKLIKEDVTISTTQNEIKPDKIETELAALVMGNSVVQNQLSPILKAKLSLKRKSDIMNCNEIKKEVKAEKKSRIITVDDDVILLSDSDQESIAVDVNNTIKKIKSEPISEEKYKQPLKDQIKTENKYLELEAFNVKQEYMAYEDEPIQINSDSDSESEHWYLRLSQNSPGKPFCKVPKAKTSEKVDDSSYSQMDDDFVTPLSNYAENDSEEEFMDDILTILPTPEKSPEPQTTHKVLEKQVLNIEEYSDDIIYFPESDKKRISETRTHPPSRDEVDASKDSVSKQETITESIKHRTVSENKKTQMIEPLVHSHKGKTKHIAPEKVSLKSSMKHSKDKPSKNHISKALKEERKKKLKEIATKQKECEHQTANISSSSISKPTSVVKVISSNRGAFLTNSEQVKPVKSKDELKKHRSKKKSIESSPPKTDQQEGDLQSPEDRENKKTQSSKPQSSKRQEHKTSKSKDQAKRDSSKRRSIKDTCPKEPESRVPLKSLKPLTGSDKTFLCKPINKVDPLQTKKPVKKVRFSDAAPDIHLFEIESGNQMRKTSSVKTSLVNIRQMPVFSLEKKTLMNILKWNPHWLEEQIMNNDPPPILGHNKPPMSIFHSFGNHHQYVQLVGDLLLMEIWECLTLGYMKIRGQSLFLEMRVGSLPPIPTQERTYDLCSISVNISLPSHDTKRVPRMGEILLVTFGPEKIQRFFYVYNVRCLPSPPNNVHSFYSIGLQATYTEKLKSMRLGEVMTGCSLAYISKELNLFEAMEYLAGSPLSEAILRPEPRHFEVNLTPPSCTSTKWTKALNESQQTAVLSSVAAALGDKPCIQMVQGPPGTGKSSVICAIVMTYIYNEQERRRQNRGKILICATSNTAVDELVIRLLNIRQNLPKPERFRMVRVGRAEAMAPRAREVSSQQLVMRDAARHGAEPAPRPGLQQEISHLEAKINMWKTAAQDAKDQVRMTYCQGRVNELVKRITIVRAGGGGGEELRPDQMMAAEKRLIEGADVIVTTLASAYSHKMRGLKRRVALCIIDEAGQAIEPETLLPLTLDVTRLTLIGDPQQLPGYICSQRAKKHGLGESLFSRLTSNCEHWARSPVALLNVQYRMHPDIVEYPNRAFYGALVHSAAPPRPDLALPPYLILGISSGDKGQGACGSNAMEACGVARLVGALAAALRAHALSLAVITPYQAHKDLIKKNLRLLQGPSETPVEVNTVDSFQGQERDVVVVSLARSHGVGFLTDTGRMNVMLTRARHALLVCLNPFAMLKNDQWRTLIEDAQERNMYRSLPSSMCQPITAGQNGHGNILNFISSHK